MKKRHSHFLRNEFLSIWHDVVIMKTRELWGKAKAKLRGHYNYYGVTDNLCGIVRFGEEVKKLLFNWLNLEEKRTASIGMSSMKC